MRSTLVSTLSLIGLSLLVPVESARLSMKASIMSSSLHHSSQQNSKYDYSSLSTSSSNLLNCSQLTTCLECTVSDGECGWCGGSTQKCLPGSKSGPASSAGQQCSAEHWDFEGKHCPCSQFKTCGECYMLKYYNDCGWCGSTNECMEAELKEDGWAPRNGTCPKYEHPDRHDQSNPFHIYDCPLDQQCSTFLNWNTCADHTEDDCSWCKSNQQCMQKHGHGKTTSCTEWEKDAWDPPCSGWETCNDCTFSTSGPRRCGWCASSGVCLEGNSSGPSGSGTCESDWLYGLSSTCPPHCAQHKTCSSCTGSPVGETFAGCGWCSTTQSCHDGGVFGPSDGSKCHLKDWRYDVCPCSDYDTCATCTAVLSGNSNKPICGWCTTANTCLPGSYLGPNTTGTCPGTSSDWYFGSKSQCVAPSKERHSLRL